MPIFIMSDRQNYRAVGESVSAWTRFKWWCAMMFGFPIVIAEDPTGNKVRISGRRVIHYVAVSQAEMDEATRKAREEQAQQHTGKGAEKRIIETPEMMIPRKRPH